MSGTSIPERTTFGARTGDRDDGPLLDRFRLRRSFYDALLSQSKDFTLAKRARIQPNNGAGFEIPAGHTFRIITPEGGQTADIALWSAHDPREKFNSVRTQLLEGWFIDRYTRLWSEIPHFRPLVTCIDDTVPTVGFEEGWRHHFHGSHCTPEMWEFKTGHAGFNSCHLNLLQGMNRFGLTEEDMSDCIAAHQKTRIDQHTGMFYFAAIDSRPGDYIEFYAEVDLLISVSVCPSGDGATLDPDPQTIRVLPLEVEIYATGTEPIPFPRWTDWRPSWRGEWDKLSTRDHG